MYLYKLTHQLSMEAPVYLLSFLDEDEIVHLIKAWMYRLDEEIHAEEFSENEMAMLLPDTIRYVGDEERLSYVVLDMYEIWEAANIKVSDDLAQKVRGASRQGYVFDLFVKKRLRELKQ